VPVINNIIPAISLDVRESPKNKKAKTATSPGVKTIRGSALLISKFLITSITQRKANVPRIDFKYRINNDSVDNEEKLIPIKNGKEKIKPVIETKKEKSNTLVSNNIFFCDSAAPAENKAEVNARINQFITDLPLLL